jgi:hypothetical protein
MDAGMDRDLGSTWWEPPPDPELFGHVVVGVDGSAASGRALEAAVAEAGRRTRWTTHAAGRCTGRARTPARSLLPSCSGT